jgi:hypothetical protein
VFDGVVGAMVQGQIRRWQPVAREYTPDGIIRDQWTLLCCVLTAEKAVKVEYWEASFETCNLHPHGTGGNKRMPVNAWLSKISQHVKSSGGGDGLHPFAQYLTHIKVPDFYARLEPEPQRVVRDATRTNFDWSTDAINALPADTRTVLLAGTNLFDMFKFTCSMAVAAEIGLAKLSDLLPTATAPTAEGKVILTKPASLFNVDTDIDQLPSYMPEQYAKLAEHVKAMLTEAKQKHKNPKAFRINQIGDLVAMSCWANSDSRLLRLEQRDTLMKAIAGMKAARKEAKTAKKADSEQKSKEREEQLAEFAPILKLFSKENIWPPVLAVGAPAGQRGPPKTPNLAAYKAYVKKYAIQQVIPAINGKAMSKSNLELFFKELCDQVILITLIYYCPPDC